MTNSIPSTPPFESATPMPVPEPADDVEAERPGDGAKVSQATQLVQVAQEVCQFFHSPDDVTYADMTVGEHRETATIRGSHFRLFLTRRYYERFGRAPSSQARADAISVLEASARFDGPTLDVHLRYAMAGGAIYIDLCDDSWRAVKIDATGYSIVAEPPVRFRRARGMAPLPVPQGEGTLENLRPFINAAGDDSFHLLLAWLVTAINPSGPFFILVLLGEQGTAKSTTARMLRSMIDPSTAPLRRPPRDERDLMIGANNAWVLALDNMSGITPALSDALCCLATGGAFATRQLTTDNEEVLFSAKRPVILNGIDELAERNDIHDRALKVVLPPLDAAKRRDELTLWAEFNLLLPSLLGALYSAAAGALKLRAAIKLPELPRMADAAIWATAAEQNLGWPAGTFIRAYTANRADSIHATMGADAFGATFRTFAAALPAPHVWQGTADALLAKLASLAPQGATFAASWPKAANSLSAKLRRLGPALRTYGITIDFDLRGRLGSRELRVQRLLDRDAVGAPFDTEGVLNRLHIEQFALAASAVGVAHGGLHDLNDASGRPSGATAGDA